METRYWRVSFTNGESIDVEAEEVKIDGQNNLIFSVMQGDTLQPVTGCNEGQWRAFRMIDKLEGEPLHSTKSPGIQFVVRQGYTSQNYLWD